MENKLANTGANADKMWAGRSAGQLDALADDFNSSLSFDCRMFRQDIRGSMAHAAMTGAKGLISAEDSALIIETLGEILADLEEGTLDFSAGGEDIHMFVEAELTKRIGDVGKRLHTARSRNDQVALDLRLYLRDESMEIIGMLRALLETLTRQATKYADTIMPGYTHLQRAQPVTFGHHLMAYAMMFVRDVERLVDAVTRMNVSPLGSCALAGTTYTTDRHMVAEKLGMDGISRNSMDGVSDRDFCLELSSVLATIMMHLSRFCEEIILWSSWEYRFVELSDAYTTGSSIMPQKKNPDMAELIRGKTGRVYGNMMGLYTVMKGLPLAYNKDMQEDKEAIFDSVDTVKLCLSVFTPMLGTLTANAERMRAAACEGFINATDCADYLTKRGVPFRTAYKVSGELVRLCIEQHTTLEELPLDVYREACDVFEADVFEEIQIENCVRKRISEGGPGRESVMAQIAYVNEFIAGL